MFICEIGSCVVTGFIYLRFFDVTLKEMYLIDTMMSLTFPTLLTLTLDNMQNQLWIHSSEDKGKS